MTVATPETDIAAFLPPDGEEPPKLDHLFVGKPRQLIQNPSVRNDYKKSSGSSDHAKTYDTTAT